MLKIIVKKESFSNLPAFVFDRNTAASEMTDAIEEIIKSPGAYRLEFVGEFIWEEKNSEWYRNFVEPLLKYAAIDNAEIHTLFGFLQGMALKSD